MSIQQDILNYLNNTDEKNPKTFPEVVAYLHGLDYTTTQIYTAIHDMYKDGAIVGMGPQMSAAYHIAKK